MLWMAISGASLEMALTHAPTDQTHTVIIYVTMCYNSQ